MPSGRAQGVDCLSWFASSICCKVIFNNYISKYKWRPRRGKAKYWAVQSCLPYDRDCGAPLGAFTHGWTLTSCKSNGFTKNQTSAAPGGAGNYPINTLRDRCVCCIWWICYSSGIGREHRLHDLRERTGDKPKILILNKTPEEDESVIHSHTFSSQLHVPIKFQCCCRQPIWGELIVTANVQHWCRSSFLGPGSLCHNFSAKFCGCRRCQFGRR